MITVISDWAPKEFLEAHNAVHDNPKFKTKDGIDAHLYCPYLHSMAEDLAGYDIVAYTKDTVVEDLLEQPCKLLLEGGTEHECVLVMWNPKSEFMPSPWPHGEPVPTGEIGWTDVTSEPWKWALSYRGLICLKDDTEALEYAHKKAKERASCL